MNHRLIITCMVGAHVLTMGGLLIWAGVDHYRHVYRPRMSR